MSRTFRLVIWIFIGLFLISGCVPNPAVVTGITPSAPVTETERPTPVPATETLAPATETPAPAEPTLTPVPKETQTPPVAPLGASATQLISIAMQDEESGWGLGETKVYRTTDGGARWADVTPPGLPASQAMLRGFFLDQASAWVIAPDPQNQAAGSLFRTQDGGATWQSSATYFGSSQLQFLDQQNGWALFVPGAAAGSAVAEIYRTVDGGATWTKVYAIDPQAGDLPGGLPFSGMKSGLAFLDASRGWVTGSEPVEKYAWLFMTEDGGKTWQHQELALPAGHENDMLSIDPPRFFTPQDGLLPVALYAQALSRVFYRTQDGGKTWSSTTPVESNGVYDFISFQEGWVWDGKTLQVTKDGGQTWTALTPNLDLSGSLVQIDFASRTTGWALAMDANGNGQLYKTEDGGENWVSP